MIVWLDSECIVGFGRATRWIWSWSMGFRLSDLPDACREVSFPGSQWVSDFPKDLRSGSLYPGGSLQWCSRRHQGTATWKPRASSWWASRQSMTGVLSIGLDLILRFQFQLFGLVDSTITEEHCLILRWRNTLLLQIYVIHWGLEKWDTLCAVSSVPLT